MSNTDPLPTNNPIGALRTDETPLLIAHRGGAELAPENTIPAFQQAIEEWGADMIELDVHATRDGECVVIHDPTVDRTTDGSGRVDSMTLSELRQLDAAHHFTPDGGSSHPFRGKGIQVPTIAEVLEALPTTPLTVEVKDPRAQRPLLTAIEEAGATDRVIIAAAADEARTEFDSYPGPVSASARQVRDFVLLHKLRLSRLWRAPVDAFQIPEGWRGRQILSPRLITALHAHDLAVHIWTVDDPADMRRLLEWGVDGIMTDRPDLLADLLTELRLREPAPVRRRNA